MQESKSTGGQDADASMEAMERDLEPGNSDVEQRGMDPEDSGVKTMEQEENSAAGQETDQNAERNSASGSGAGEQEAYTKMELDGKMHGEPAKKGTMFDRWAAKSAGQGAVAGEDTGESARSAFPEDGEAKHTPPFPEPGQDEKVKGKQEDPSLRTTPHFRNRKETGGRKEDGSQPQGNPAERFSGKGKRYRRAGGKSSV